MTGPLLRSGRALACLAWRITRSRGEGCSRWERPVSSAPVPRFPSHGGSLLSTTAAAERFRERFGAAPDAVALAPGRVNLIGEHVDYHDLPVLPVALDRTVRVAYRVRADRFVRIANVSPDFPERPFELVADPGREPPGDWGNYLRAGARVAFTHGARRGIEALVDSDLPVAAGLSSSSALVVAVARAFLAASGVEVDSLRLAAALAKGERFVGTDGGGMDQAVCLGGLAGHVVRIDFAPLAWSHIPLPSTWRIVVAHSGVAAHKSGAAREAYNERRRSGEAARRAVAASLRQKDASFRQLLALAPEGVLLERAARLLDERLVHRFRHVVTEARRVAAAERLLRAGDATGFGGLLVASHVSLRDDYRVSHPRVDALVDAALDADALGARLTGAGFGGCMLALTDEPGAERVQEALRRTLVDAGVDREDAVVFVARAGGGARVEPM